MSRPRSPGVIGWVLIGLVVVVLDAAALASNRETLSAAYARARRHRIGGPFTLAVVVLLVAHLEQLPGWRRIDPLHLVASKLRHP